MTFSIFRARKFLGRKIQVEEALLKTGSEGPEELASSSGVVSITEEGDFNKLNPPRLEGEGFEIMCPLEVDLRFVALARHSCGSRNPVLSGFRVAFH